MRAASSRDELEAEIGNAVKKATSARTLLEPMRYPGDAQVHLVGGRSGALVDEAE